MLSKVNLIVALIGGAMAGNAVAAPIVAADVTSFLGGNIGASSSTRGFSFTTASDINITSLGWFDNNQDGLANSHQVGIFSTSGTLLVSGTVAAGVADPLTGFFRYTSVLTGSPLLTAGSYVIGGLSTAGDATIRNLNSSQISFAPGITYGQDRTITGTPAVFAFPDTTQGFNIGYFGPNFQFDSASAPELSGSAGMTPFLCLALLTLAWRQRRSEPSAA